ncbi:MAG: hypothetical protein HY286_10815 [Planctomycetes bacterium]|nr:hypothetical protein [Planctomycetota bacterium]
MSVEIHLLVDGERDAKALPHIIHNILESKPECRSITSFSPRHWKDLRFHNRDKKARLQGYAKKLQYIIDENHNGIGRAIVAVVDRDRDADGARVRELRSTRTDARLQAIRVPLAIGEAIPHGEAWLLPDRHVVAGVFEVDPAEVNIKAKSPKDELQRLGEKKITKEKFSDRLETLAKKVRVHVIADRSDNGFAEFAEDIKKELGSLFSGAASS